MMSMCRIIKHIMAKIVTGGITLNFTIYPTVRFSGKYRL